MKTGLHDRLRATQRDRVAPDTGRMTGSISNQQPSMDKVRDSAGYLSDNFHRVPLMMIPCMWGRLDNASVVMGAGGWGSLLPAVWSFMLALPRARAGLRRGRPST